jgi:predicted ester cyclase
MNFFFKRICLVLLLLISLLPSYGQQASVQNTNKKTISRYLDEVINKQQMNRMGEFFSQDYTWHQMDGKSIRISEDSFHVAMLRFIFKAIPDIQYTIDNIVLRETWLP